MRRGTRSLAAQRSARGVSTATRSGSPSGFVAYPGHPFEQGFDLKLWPERLGLPLTWKDPKRIFVNSMSDLYHPGVPIDFIEGVFRTMNRARWHSFQILTKRAERIAALGDTLPWSSNIWQGVSVEDERVTGRIELLRSVPAHVRFLSLEPLIGPLDNLNLEGIHWVIVGGESGPKARPMRREWVTRIRDQCRRDSVPFFFKQWGGVRKAVTGRLLDGRTWDQFPAPQAS